MDARVENKNGVFVVTLSGRMNFESADVLKNNCLNRFKEGALIFNLGELNFVGSSGLTPFLELLTELSKRIGTNFKICSVGTEFLRLFESGTSDGIEIYQNVNEAYRSFIASDVQAITKLKPFGLKLTIE